MIIDALCHGIGQKMIRDGTKWTRVLDDRPEVIIKEMDRHGVDMAIAYRASSYHPSNELVQSLVRTYPDRFPAAFCGYDKTVNDETGPRRITGREAAEQIEKALKEPEFKGVTECAIFQLTGTKKNEATLQEVMKEWRLVMDVVAANKVPIAFHTGVSGGYSGRMISTPVRWYDPILLDDLCYEYPETPIIIAHSGGSYPPHYQNALLLAYEYENVYLDTSKSRTDVIEQAVKEIGASRILFSSDWVGIDPIDFGPTTERHSHMHDRNIRIVREAKISDEDKDMIFYKNIKSLLNL